MVDRFSITGFLFLVIKLKIRYARRSCIWCIDGLRCDTGRLHQY